MVTPHPITCHKLPRRSITVGTVPLPIFQQYYIWGHAAAQMAHIHLWISAGPHPSAPRLWIITLWSCLDKFTSWYTTFTLHCYVITMATHPVDCTILHQSPPDTSLLRQMCTATAGPQMGLSCIYPISLQMLVRTEKNHGKQKSRLSSDRYLNTEPPEYETKVLSTWSKLFQNLMNIMCNLHKIFVCECTRGWESQGCSFRPITPNYRRAYFIQNMLHDVTETFYLVSKCNPTVTWSTQPVSADHITIHPAPVLHYFIFIPFFAFMPLAKLQHFLIRTLSLSV